MKKALISLAIIANLPVAFADEKHDHTNHIGAHVHGEAQMNVVLEGDELKIMLESPAMNLMGFEYEPKTEADLETSHKALHELKDAEWLIVKGGECELHEGDVDWQYAEAVHAHFHGNKEHKHDDKEHKHDDKEHKHDDKEHKHDEHEHKHSDVGAKWDFDCKTPSAVKSLSIEAFEHFSGFEKINVQWIVGDKQGAQILTKDSHELHFDK